MSVCSVLLEYGVVWSTDTTLDTDVKNKILISEQTCSTPYYLIMILH